MNEPAVSHRQNSTRLALALAIALGIVLRLVDLSLMEFKADEIWTFERIRRFGSAESLALLGMPSGANGVLNPGMSVWIFLGIGELARAVTIAPNPVSIATGVALLNCFALIIGLAWGYRITRGTNRNAWLWAMALAAVNPLALLFHRKIWAQSVLPTFSILFLMSWNGRKKPFGAFCWGIIGACLGQIHMSGFFFAASFILLDLIRGDRSTRWLPWLFGSLLGAIPLIPWMDYLLHLGPGESGSLKPPYFWLLWLSDALGLGLNFNLGADFEEFLRAPLIGGQATHGIAVAHLILLIIGLGTTGVFLRRLTWKSVRIARDSHPLEQAGKVAFLFYGVILTFTGILTRRHYLIITFPLVWFTVARFWITVFPHRAKFLLSACLLLQLGISVELFQFIKRHGGARGDYGRAYSRTLIEAPSPELRVRALRSTNFTREP